MGVIIIKIELLIYQSKANLDEKVLFIKTTLQLDPVIRKMPVNSTFENEDSIFHSGPRFTCY